MRSSDWSSDVCSSDRWRVRPRSARDQGPRLVLGLIGGLLVIQAVRLLWALTVPLSPFGAWQPPTAAIASPAERRALFAGFDPFFRTGGQGPAAATVTALGLTLYGVNINEATGGGSAIRSEEHTSELQSLMRISYAVFCLK